MYKSNSITLKIDRNYISPPNNIISTGMLVKTIPIAPIRNIMSTIIVKRSMPVIVPVKKTLHMNTIPLIVPVKKTLYINTIPLIVPVKKTIPLIVPVKKTIPLIVPVRKTIPVILPVKKTIPVILPVKKTIPVLLPIENTIPVVVPIENTISDVNIITDHTCYILRSSVSNRVYIGYTVNFKRRLRQHNGEIVGGAKKTRKGRPWYPICFIKGFYESSAALRFEYRLQHPKCRRKAGQDIIIFTLNTLLYIINNGDGSIEQNNKMPWPMLNIFWYNNGYSISHAHVTNNYVSEHITFT